MKIGSTNETPALADVSLRAARAPAAAPASAAAVRTGSDVEVSAAGAQMSELGSGEFDQAKVDAIRLAIQQGRFTVNAGAIADRLIADAAALLAPRTPQ